MAISMKRILAKKKWTGKDVGKALLLSLVNDLLYKNDPSFKPILSQEQFVRMEQSIFTEEDALDYSVLRTLFKAIMDSKKTRRRVEIEMAYGGDMTVGLLLSLLEHERRLGKEESYPLCITQERFDRYCQKARAKLDKKKVHPDEVLFRMIDYWIDGDSTEIPTEVADAMEKDGRGTLTNKRVLKAIPSLCGLGYHLYPDGRRSDSMTEEEQAEMDEACALSVLDLDLKAVAVNQKSRTPKEIALVNTQSLFFYGVDSVKKLYKTIAHKKWKFGKGADEGWMAEAELLSSTMISGDGTFAERFLLALAGGKLWVESDPPDSMSKSEVLKSAITAYHGHMDEFSEDFPLTYEATVAYLCKAVSPLSEMQTFGGCSGIPLHTLSKSGIADYGKGDRLTNGLLADAMAEEEGLDIHGDEEAYDTYVHAYKGGMAVMQGDNKPYTGNGDNLFTSTIEGVMDTEVQQIKICKYRESFIKKAIKKAYAFNAFMKVLGKVYRIKELGLIQIPVDWMEQMVHSANASFINLYCSVHGNEKERNRKRTFLKSVFEIVDIEGLKPNKKAVAEVEKKLRAIGYTEKALYRLESFDDFIQRIADC